MEHVVAKKIVEIVEILDNASAVSVWSIRLGRCFNVNNLDRSGFLLFVEAQVASRFAERRLVRGYEEDLCRLRIGLLSFVNVCRKLL